jgi:hypothetical protein
MRDAEAFFFGGLHGILHQKTALTQLEAVIATRRTGNASRGTGDGALHTSLATGQLQRQAK